MGTHGPHVSDLPLLSGRARQPLRARGAVHPCEASNAFVAFLPKEAWGPPASLSAIGSGRS